VPNVKSAEKRVRTNERRRLRNRAAKSALKTGLKNANEAIAAQEPDTAKKAVQEAISLVGRTHRKGVINRNRAARLQSRMQKRLNKKLAGPPSA